MEYCKKASLCDLERLAIQILHAHCPEVLSSPQPIPIERIMESGYDLHLRPVILIPDSSILGETVFLDGIREIWRQKSIGWEAEMISVSPGDILLDEIMFEKMRERSAFTQAHELAHWILHQTFFTGQENGQMCRKLEAEANAFASAFLLPRDPVRVVTKAFFQQHQKHWKCFYNLENRNNQILFLELAECIAKTFFVSKDTARIRLKNLFRL